jgi:hypothetical protein
MNEHDTVESFDVGDACPVHRSPFKKRYTFGSTLSAETDVCVFKGCRCAVAVSHDPVGILRSVATYHASYDSASGVGRLRAMDAAAKYR